MEAESIEYKKQVIEAFRQQGEDYQKSQRIFLRPMKFNGTTRTPIIDTPQILGLVATNGNKLIDIEEFNREYEGIHLAYIRGMVVGTSFEGLPMPDPVQYAKMRDYNVQFKKGDIIKNPFYDPAMEKRFYTIR